MDNPTDAAVDARFYIDHSMIYDRKTGKRVTTNDDSVFCDGRVACCALLNELADITTRQPGPEDVERIAQAPTRSALDSAFDPMLGNTPVRKAVVDMVLGLFENVRRPLTEVDVERIAEYACDKEVLRNGAGAYFKEQSSHMKKIWINQVCDTLAAASWRMTVTTDSTASDRLAWLEKTHSDTMDQNARLIVERDALNGRVAVLEDRLATVLSQRSTYKADRDIANARVATLESELAAAQMSATDLKNLDEVVAILGIEDSTTTPAEAVFELHKEIERLRSELAAAKSQPPGTIRLGEGLTEAQETDLDAIIYYYISQGWPVNTQTERALKPTWSKALADAQAQSISRHRERVYAALRASATPKPEAVKVASGDVVLSRIILPPLTDDQAAYLQKIIETSGKFDPNFMVTGHKPHSDYAIPKPEAVDWVKRARDYQDRDVRDYMPYMPDVIINGLCEQIAALRAGGV